MGVSGPEAACINARRSIDGERSLSGRTRAQEEGTVKTRTQKTARLGDLIAAAFDEAARYTTDPREVSRLATQAVRHLVRHARRISALPLRAAVVEAT